MKKVIDQDLIDSAMSYSAYRTLIDELLLDNRTTGANQSESMINYARMGQKRMKKWDKIAKLNPNLTKKLEAIDRPITWLVITEGWCGDAGQSIPFMNKMAEANDHIDLRLVLRDEHPHLMDHFLTNGARSIPILVAVDPKSYSVLGTWGPRPDPIQKEFIENKTSQEKSGKEFSEYMHLWYAKDKGEAMQLEFLSILDTWTQKLQSLPVQAG